MPTQDRHDAVTADEARARAGRVAFPPLTGERDGGVGLEPEFFPISVDAAGSPGERLVLSRPRNDGVVQVIDGIADPENPVLPRIGRPPHAFFYPLARGGRLTFEPGAQVEHSTAVHPGAASALADVETTLGVLRAAFGARGVLLAAVGLDVWHDVEEVPQQLRAGRYTAQAAYYRQRGHWGAVMMRHTASLQINLDLGREGVWQERWLLANLMSPLLTASFSTSPGSGVASVRARAWQELDPTRSGFPRLLTDGAGDDPRGEYAEAALDADVMLFRLDDEHFIPASPGLRFVDWIANPHPRFGWPTMADLEYHLTTLFFEVRPRGFLELRAGEAVPDAIRPAQVVLAAALLYDDVARTEALTLLGGIRPELDAVWHRAAERGVHDDELADLACRLWEIGLHGAERMTESGIGRDNLRATADFLDRYPGRGRLPGDDLAELLADDPGRALAWAASADRP